MSWGKSAAGAPAYVLTQVEGWAGAVASFDGAQHVRDVVAAAHQRQVAHAVATITAFTACVPAGYHLSVTANGHHNGEDADTSDVRVCYYNPVPIAAAGFDR